MSRGAIYKPNSVFSSSDNSMSGRRCGLRKGQVAMSLPVHSGLVWSHIIPSIKCWRVVMTWGLEDQTELIFDVPLKLHDYWHLRAREWTKNYSQSNIYFLKRSWLCSKTLRVFALIHPSELITDSTQQPSQVQTLEAPLDPPGHCQNCLHSKRVEQKDLLLFWAPFRLSAFELPGYSALGLEQTPQWVHAAS